MSIKVIKATLEEHIKTNLTNVAIKWNNTNSYTKNGATLGQTEIDALTLFVEPKIIPITSNRELISDTSPYNTIVFFQLDIYNKINTGTGAVFDVIDLVDATLREVMVGTVLCTYTKTIGSFTEGEFEITPHRIKASAWS